MLAPFIKKEEGLIRRNVLLMGHNTREAISSPNDNKDSIK